MEYGLGIMIAFPEELLKLRAELTNLPQLGAFPMPVRADTLARMGVDAGLLATMGISLDRDAFSIGLSLPGTGGSGIQVTGVNSSIVNAGSTSANMSHGGGARADASTTTYSDGHSELRTYSETGTMVEHYDSNGNKV
ncbi:hypothetical protein ACFQO7_35440 [Catellatospora aurea]|uniref:Uncharacterized protein n=1 Tax=Catellatospora aurea TaxID=1337874 RepID=A0ABW2H774_9ACTN